MLKLYKCLYLIPIHYNMILKVLLYSFKVVSYSPNGEMIALGSRDNNIYVYQVSENHKKFSRLGRCTVSYFFL